MKKDVAATLPCGEVTSTCIYSQVSKIIVVPMCWMTASCNHWGLARAVSDDETNVWKVERLAQGNRVSNSQPFTLIIHTHKNILKRLPWFRTSSFQNCKTIHFFLSCPVLGNVTKYQSSHRKWGYSLKSKLAWVWEPRPELVKSMAGIYFKRTRRSEDPLAMAYFLGELSRLATVIFPICVLNIEVFCFSLTPCLLLYSPS